MIAKTIIALNEDAIWVGLKANTVTKIHKSWHYKNKDHIICSRWDSTSNICSVNSWVLWRSLSCDWTTFCCFDCSKCANRHIWLWKLTHLPSKHTKHNSFKALLNTRLNRSPRLTFSLATCTQWHLEANSQIGFVVWAERVHTKLLKELSENSTGASMGLFTPSWDGTMLPGHSVGFWMFPRILCWVSPHIPITLCAPLR